MSVYGPAADTAILTGRRAAFVGLMCDADLDHEAPAVDRAGVMLTPAGEIVWPDGLREAE